MRTLPYGRLPLRAGMPFSTVCVTLPAGLIVQPVPVILDRSEHGERASGIQHKPTNAKDLLSLRHSLRWIPERLRNLRRSRMTDVTGRTRIEDDGYSLFNPFFSSSARYPAQRVSFSRPKRCK